MSTQFRTTGSCCMVYRWYIFTEKKKDGITIAICDTLVDSVRSEVRVKWLDKTFSLTKILELQYTKPKKRFPYYHDHLAVLGKGTNLYYILSHFYCLIY